MWRHIAHCPLAQSMLERSFALPAPAGQEPHSPHSPAHDVLHVQPLLAPRIQQPVITVVVVTLQVAHAVNRALVLLPTKPQLDKLRCKRPAQQHKEGCSCKRVLQGSLSADC